MHEESKGVKESKGVRHQKRPSVELQCINGTWSGEKGSLAARVQRRQTPKSVEHGTWSGKKGSLQRENGSGIDSQGKLVLRQFGIMAYENAKCATHGVKQYLIKWGARAPPWPCGRNGAAAKRGRQGDYGRVWHESDKATKNRAPHCRMSGKPGESPPRNKKGGRPTPSALRGISPRLFYSVQGARYSRFRRRSASG
jgi:hypothetical protein